MALPVLLGACFTSCKEDTQPRLEVPTEFVLNTPLWRIRHIFSVLTKVIRTSMI